MYDVGCRGGVTLRILCIEFFVWEFLDLVDMDVDVGIERLVVLIHWLAFKLCIQVLEAYLGPDNSRFINIGFFL